MRRNTQLLMLLAITIYLLPRANAQGRSTAARSLELSGFGLLGDTYTGLGGATNGLGGRNFSLTIGADLSFYNIGHYGIAAEARGTYPISSGHVDGQLSVLGGIRIERRSQTGTWHGIAPYIDLLGGRGEIRYVDGGYPTPGFNYTATTTNIGSAGGGFELPISGRLAIKADAQVQYWPTPVTPNMRIIAKQGSAGLVYRFGVANHPR